MLPRADVRDRLIGADSLDALPQGARVGTSSPRRAAQLLRARPDLRIVPIRGNLDTRLAKVEAGEVDATLLAAAGLDRLGRPKVGKPLPVDVMLPAPGQGAIGIECRADDARNLPKLARLDVHIDTSTAVPRRAGVYARAGRLLPFAGRGAGPGPGGDGPFAGRRSSARTAGTALPTRRASPSATTDAAAALARAMLGRAPDVDPPAVRRPMRPLFILRPEPGASATAAEARAMGLEARDHPFVRGRPLPWTAPDPGQFDALAAHQRQCGPPRRRRAGDG